MMAYQLLYYIRSTNSALSHIRQFSTEWNFLLFKDQLDESEQQETKEIIVPSGKFCLVENGPCIILAKFQEK